jgi:F420-dependent oxidoreductase-like protein
MKLGVHFIDFTLPGEPATLARTVADTAKTAEDNGCSKFTVMDHWFQMEFFRTAQDPMLEGYTTLGYLAAVTSTMELATLVTGVTYRHPGLLAKIVTTLDVLSGGRAQLGIGAAWYEREHVGLGVPYPSTTERFERLEETLQIVRQMWSDNDGPYNGTYYQLAETLCHPLPISRPHPKIMIGGNGEKKTLKLVAQYADVSNLITADPDEVRRKYEILERHCVDVGRDPNEIERTVAGSFMPTDDKDEYLRVCEAMSAHGVTTISVTPQGPDPVGWISGFASYVVPRLATI